MLAKSVAKICGARLIRLQCYEGLDEAKALYEWNYKKQLLRIQADREHETSWEVVESDIFSEAFLLVEAPVLQVRSPLCGSAREQISVVELDRADERLGVAALQTVEAPGDQGLECVDVDP